MKYKAFLSYSHTHDNNFSSVFQRSLETFAKKWFQIRRIKIFRDETNLAVTPSLWSSIKEALQESEYFIYLASPKAANSKWVKKEIEYWLNNKDKNKLIIVLTSGILLWDEGENKFNKRSNSLPKELIFHFRDEPLYLDFRWVKSNKIHTLDTDHRYKNTLATLASVLLEEDKDSLTGYNVNQVNIRKKFVQGMFLTVSILLIISLFASYYALDKKNEVVKFKKTSSKKGLDRNYNLAKSLEQKALRAIEKAELIKNEGYKEITSFDLIKEGDQSIIEYQKAWLYAFEAKKLKLPKGKRALTKSTLSKLTNISVKMIGSEKNLPFFVIKTDSSVNSIAFSPSGNILASGSNDTLIRLWDVKSGQLTQTFKGHSGEVIAIAYSPNGKTIASASSDKTVRLWDVKSKQSKITILKKGGEVENLLYSPDGTVIATSSRELISYENIEFKKILKSKGYSEEFFTLDQVIYLWDSDTGQLKQILYEPRESHSSAYPSALAYSPDGGLLASISVGGLEREPINLWDVKKLKLKLKFKGSSSGGTDVAIAFSPDGETIALGDIFKVGLWNANTGELKQTFGDNSDEIRSLAYSPNGKILASGSFDEVILWNAYTGYRMQTFSSSATSISFSPDGKILATTSFDGINFWMINKQLRKFINLRRGVNSVAYNPDGEEFASASQDNVIRIWNANTGQLKKMLAGHSGWVNSIVFSSDGKTLVSASNDSSIYLWDVKTGKLKKTLKKHSASVNAVTFSPDNTMLASSSGDPLSNDNTIRIWNANTGELEQTLKGNSGSVYSVMYSPDGNMIASTSTDNTVRLWNTNTGKVDKIFKHPAHVIVAVYNSDGTVLASASNKTIYLWSMETGQIMQKLKGHSSGITSLVYSPNGEILASTSSDNTIRFWDAYTGRLKKTFEGHLKTVNSLAFSPDSKTFISGSNDKTIRIWDKDQLTILKLFNDFDPDQVSNALSFIWKMDLNKDNFEIKSYTNNDDSQFQLLSDMQKEGKSNIYQLVHFLEAICAYKDKKKTTECKMKLDKRNIKTKTIKNIESTIPKVVSNKTTSSNRKKKPVDIYVLQRKLKDKGFYQGPIDGVVTEEVKKALDNFITSLMKSNRDKSN